VTEPVSLSSVMPAPKRPVWPLLVLAAAVLIVAGGVGGYFLLRPKPAIAVTGMLELSTSTSQTLAGHCAGSGAYADITPGAQVTITDGTGATIALGALGTGDVTKNLTCGFPFALSVPAGKGFYGIEVAHRGRLQLTEAKLAQPIQLTLGG